MLTPADGPESVRMTYRKNFLWRIQSIELWLHDLNCLTGRTDKPELEVTGLTPGKQYQFRVTAVNDEGDSEPLVSDAPIIAKNPYGKT